MTFSPERERQVAAGELERHLKRYGTLVVPGWLEAEDLARATHGWTPPHLSPGNDACRACGLATAWVAPDGRPAHPFCRRAEMEAAFAPAW